MVDEAILTGNGVGRPLGVLNSNATISVARTVANRIIYEDLAGMYSRIHPAFFQGAVWVAHPSTLPQLLILRRRVGNYVWVPSRA